jgi:hypothetical protein
MKKTQLSKHEYYLRFLVILFAALSPLICLFSYGYMPSLSQYWDTPMQPLFIIANAATSYYLIGLKNWRLSSILLILLTAFSVEYYNDLHNILAVLFFIATIFPLVKINNFKFCLKIYLSSILLVPFSMFFAEFVAIFAMCIYHILSLNKLRKIQENRVN